MKTPFDIKFKPQIESGEYKVETRDGKPVTIYRWDFKDSYDTPIMGSYVCEDGAEYCAAWTNKGLYSVFGEQGDYDLFIITPEIEKGHELKLTKLESAVDDIIRSFRCKSGMDADEFIFEYNSWIKKITLELLGLAKKDTIERIQKEINNWMPDNPEGDEYEEGKRLAFRSVLVLLREIGGVQ